MSGHCDLATLRHANLRPRSQVGKRKLRKLDAGITFKGWGQQPTRANSPASSVRKNGSKERSKLTAECKQSANFKIEENRMETRAERSGVKTAKGTGAGSRAERRGENSARAEKRSEERSWENAESFTAPVPEKQSNTMGYNITRPRSVTNEIKTLVAGISRGTLFRWFLLGHHRRFQGAIVQSASKQSEAFAHLLIKS